MTDAEGVAVAGPSEGASSATAGRIRASAVRLFYEQGFQATTVRQIVAACELTPGSLYNHFPSKDDILYVIIKDSHDRIDSVISASIAAAKPDPQSQLMATLHAFVLYHTQFPMEARITNRDYGALPAIRREEIVKRRRHTRGLIEDLVSSGVDEHVFQLPEVGGRTNPRLVTMALMGMVMMVAEWFRPDRAWTADALSDLLSKLTVAAISPDR